MDLNQSVSISPGVVFQEVHGEIVLLDLSSENYFGLDEVGARVWQLLQEENTLQGVFDKMLAEYDVDAGTLAADFSSLFTNLLDAKLVELGKPD